MLYTVKLKTKGTVPKHYCLVSKFVSHRDYGIAILKLLYVYTRVEQISKYITIMKARFLAIGERNYKQGREEVEKKTNGIGL